ncbi:HD-GYP domain-containing protein [Acidipila sp. EB88]|uniref:HD-GYP domain-containing protein n=1 Tax=Acidipila sp. EB88 TaxID=2305226 RepID=UPI000F5E912E|nr:HD-GYP domain-containing protein [Acidipila sp. EB88]RRA48982.1 HD-GYP domain-containing protein [Acidipila sp. EB88]
MDQGPTAGRGTHRASLLHEIISALSFALDLTEGAVPGHAIRSCILARRIAEAMQLHAALLGDLYFAVLLKDVGCSSNAARMCQIIGGDDRAVKAGAKLANWRQPLKPDLAAVQMLWRHVLPDAGPFRRTSRILRMAADQHKNNRELIRLRCDRGASIVRKIGMPERIARAVRCLDEHWDGGGYPDGLKGEAIPLVARLMGVAQHLDAFCMCRGPQAAIDVMVARSGNWFDPTIVKVALSLHNARTLWGQCMPSDDLDEAHRVVLDLEPDNQVPLQAREVDVICEAFAEVVDAKSPFTFYHSQGVADVATVMARMMRLPEPRIEMLRRAALLHDIGKLCVPNSILDKPGRLSAEEFEVVKAHPQMGRDILSRVGMFGCMATIAGEHHERLDGSGYPFGLSASELSLDSRLVAVADVYGALAEHRPYRAAMEPREIAMIMERDVPGRLDGECYEALRAVLLQAGRGPSLGSQMGLSLTASMTEDSAVGMMAGDRAARESVRGAGMPMRPQSR